MRLILFCGIVFFCTSPIVQAQNFRFYAYTTEQGLATNLVKSVQADKEGFIWLGSDAGVSRFDSKKFLNFKKEFPNPYMKNLVLTKAGRILIVNDMGLFEANGTDFSLVLDGANSPQINKLNYPKDLLESSKGEYWIAEPQSIVRYKDNQVKRYTFAEKYRAQSFSRSFQIFEFNEKIYAAAFSGHFFVFNPENDDFETLPIETQSQTHCILKLPDSSSILIGTSDGIFKVDLTSFKLQKVSSLGDISVLTLIDNRIFVGTWTSGLYQIEDFSLGFEPVKIKKFPCKHVNDIYIDREKGVWLACDEGLVLMKQTFFSGVEIPQTDAYIQGIFPVSGSEVLVTEGSRIWKVGKAVQKVFECPDESGLLGAGKVGDWIITGSLSDELYGLNKGKISKIEGHNKGVAFNFHLDNRGFLWACRHGEENMVYRIDSKGKLKIYSADEGIKGRTFVCKSTKDYLYIAGEGVGHYLYRLNYNKDVLENISLPLPISQIAVNDMYVKNDDSIYLAANERLFLYQKNNITLIDLTNLDGEPIKAIYPATGGGLWLGTNLGLLRYLNGSLMFFDERDGLPTRTIVYRGVYQDSSGRVWVATANGLATTQLAIIQEAPKTIAPYIFYAKAKDWQAQPNSQHEYGTDWEFSFATLSYPNDNARYQYRFNGGDWIELKENRLFLNRLSWGKYRLEIRALQHGHYSWSDPTAFTFEIKKPWYIRVWFIALVMLGLAGLIYLIVEFYTYRLKLQKAELEDKVKQRTLEIIAQKDQISQQKQEIERQNERVQSSINTASRIQQAILPSQAKMQSLFKEHFVIYMPKDVVSGDFYWVSEVEGIKIVAVADCTGHGVPGALMSMIGVTLLDECVQRQRIFSPEKILEYLDTRLVEALRYEGSNSIEGMDMAICSIQGNTLEFAGAKRPALILTKDGELTKLQGISRPLGGFASERTKPFHKESIAVHEGDCFYMFSDGITDQFGENNRSKFAIKGVSSTLLAYHRSPLALQKEQLLKSWELWKGNSRILDDILVLGVRL